MTDPHAASMDWSAAGQESIALFRDLLRLDTTNPPGQERQAAELLAQALREDGVEPWIVESAPGRANLVARLPANDPAPGAGPLLLAGHTDVVPATASDWTHPPFKAVLAEDHLWGRGALDMKNMVAMSAMTMRWLARQDTRRRRDLIFAAVADEEEGCAFGSQFLVEQHPDRVRAQFMLGEVGGFWLNLGGRTYIPVQIAEKGLAHLRLRARGPAGHGSMPRADNSLVRLGRAIERLGTRRLDHSVTPVMEGFIQTLAQTQPRATGALLKGLLHPKLAGPLLDHVMPDKDVARNFNALLHNTVSPTMTQASAKRNVIPDEATCELDGRMLPGTSAEQLRRQVERVIEDDQVQVELVKSFDAVSMAQHQSPLYDLILKTVQRHAPEAICVPYMISGYTDAQFFSRLGARCYGFSPLKLPPTSGLKFAQLFHGVDERVPVEGYLWGQQVLFELVRDFLAS